MPTPLELNVMMGREDARLLEHIAFLERAKNRADGGRGISDGEQRTLDILYKRLDEITKPNQ